MQAFEGKIAVVTGAASGMGRAFAQRFAEEGMKVVLADVEVPALEQEVAELRSQEHDVIGVTTDVRNLEAVQALARAALDAFGKVHIICNNAGVEGYLDGPIWEATDRDWQWTFGVNFWGMANGVRTFLPILLAQDEEAHVVNTCSATSLVMGGNMYGITKHAALALTETLYSQLKQRNAKIGVTALCPGVINTRLFEGRRNRPAELINEGAAAKPDAAEAMRRGWFERAAQSTQPDEVADLLVDAIRSNKLYLLTDHIWDERMRSRFDSINNGTNP